MISYGVTDIGRKRAANQDSFIVDRVSSSTLLAVVCDGMGGAAGGLEASSIACSVFADSVEADLARMEERGRDVTPALCERILRRGVDFANSAVYRRAAEDPGLAGMGTTLVAALVSGERIYVANVGDSRLYSVTDGVATQVTHDHSYVQLLVDMGRITPEQAKKSSNKNIITRAVGTASEVECDVFVINTLPDVILLCSDGLTNMLSESEIGERFSPGLESESDLTEVCCSLVDSANEKGGPDNITAVAVAFGVADEENEDEELLPIESSALTDRIDLYEEDDDDRKEPETGVFVSPEDDKRDPCENADGEKTDIPDVSDDSGDEPLSDGPEGDGADTGDGEDSAPTAGGADPASEKEGSSHADTDPGEEDVPRGEDEPEQSRGRRKKKASGQLRLPGMGLISRNRKKDKKKG